MSHELTDAQRFFFENNGYLVVENFLAPSHVATLRSALTESIEKRREREEKELPQIGMTHIHGEKSTRIFYILGDHPAFLELLDWQPILSYVTGLLNQMPHHHASDAIVEHSAEFIERPMGWHIDGHDEGYRNLRPIPLLATESRLLSDGYVRRRTGESMAHTGKPHGDVRSEPRRPAVSARISGCA